MCKVPYSVEDRYSKDTLPYHITLQSWNENQKEEAIKIFNQIKIEQIKLNVNSINIKNSYKNSYNLYLGIEKNKELLEIYEKFYELIKNPKYNPTIFKPHITLHCDTNYEKIINIKNIIENNFKKFEIEFKEIGLFEIYPSKRII